MADRLNIANPNAKTGFYTAKKDQGIGYIGVGCPYEGGRALYKNPALKGKQFSMRPEYVHAWRVTCGRGGGGDRMLPRLDNGTHYRGAFWPRL
jgi:hypothetical protein